MRLSRCVSDTRTSAMLMSETIDVISSVAAFYFINPKCDKNKNERKGNYYKGNKSTAIVISRKWTGYNQNKTLRLGSHLSRRTPPKSIVFIDACYYIKDNIICFFGKEHRNNLVGVLWKSTGGFLDKENYLLMFLYELVIQNTYNWSQLTWGILY